jgi:DNA-directed RNA polymerase beta' subunit
MSIQAEEEQRPTTGPEAIYDALSRVDVESLEREQRDIVRKGPKSKRARAVRILNALEGMRRNDILPKDLMVRKVPVIPAAFRPFNTVGDTFIPGDANELYRDLINLKNSHQQVERLLGPEGAGDSRLNVYDAVRAVYGFGDPVEPKTKQRGVSGFMKNVIGSRAKFGYVQRKMLSKPQDAVSRATIVSDPDLSLDEIGIPEESAWKMYGPHVQRRLVQSGMPPASALRELVDRGERARKAMDRELEDRPVIYSRAPSWHKYNVIAGRPKLRKGHAIGLNTLVLTGLNADFDGDAMNLHVPATKESVDEARKKLMPSKMLFDIRDFDKVVPVPKHEMILGLSNAQSRPAGKKHKFNSEREALAAVQAGEVDLNDEVEF